MEGFSVIICCHNGASRLPTTLARLKLQDPPAVPWEVLIVDNASADGTAETARSCWQDGPAPLRVISEPRLGVRYARERGLAEAKYEFLGFVDDDNWVTRNWVRTAYDVISSDSSVSAVGSIRDPVCEIMSPAWFDDFHSIYAVLTDRDFASMSQPPSYLPTAGLCMRRAAWESLLQNGFHFQLEGSAGQKLQGGEDTELTLALRLSGWNLRIDPRLRLEHFMPCQRLRWSYLRGLKRAYGASHVPLDAYTEYSLSLKPGPRSWLSDQWWYQFAKSLRKISSQPKTAMSALFSRGEGQNQIVEIEQEFGRARGLLQLRGRYGKIRREVRKASWRRSSPFNPDAAFPDAESANASTIEPCS